MRKYLHSLKEVTRVESVTKSPILNFVTETLDGISYVRCFRKHNEFVEYNFMLINRNISANMWLTGLNNWLSIRLNFLTIVIMSVSVLAAIYFRPSFTPQDHTLYIGLLLNYIINL